MDLLIVDNFESSFFSDVRSTSAGDDSDDDDGDDDNDDVFIIHAFGVDVTNFLIIGVAVGDNFSVRVTYFFNKVEPSPWESFQDVGGLANERRRTSGCLSTFDSSSMSITSASVSLTKRKLAVYKKKSIFFFSKLTLFVFFVH